MRRLAGVDAGLLALEAPVQPMDILAVLVLTGEKVTLEVLRRHVANRLDAVPALRGRLLPVPGGLGRPVLVDDHALDLRVHVCERRLAAPGDEAELDRWCARAMERPLDRRAPLWRMTLLHGLAGSRQALVMRIHHCLVDGLALVNTFDRLLGPLADDRPEDRPDLAGGTAGSGDAGPAPSAVRLLLAGLADQARAARSLPSLVRRTHESLRAERGERTTCGAAPPAGREAPGTVINRGLASARRVARTELASPDLRAVKRAAGVTFNDVALAVVAGALRDYLLARRALPVCPLVARVPVSLEPAGSARMLGNRISGWTTTLATDEEEPWCRLVRIGAATREAKRRFATARAALLEDWLAQLPPALVGWALRHGEALRRRDLDRIDANVTVSSLRGPRRALALGGAPVEGLHLAGPPNSGVATNVVLTDYGSRLFVGILTFADSVDDPAELAQGMHRALGELVGAARGR